MAVIEALENLDGDYGEFYLAGRIDICMDDYVIGCVVPIDDWWEYVPTQPLVVDGRQIKE